MPSHTAATARPRLPKVRATGPGPLRTARGAGRLELPRAGMRVLPLLVRGAGLLLVLRDRVLEDLLALPREAVERDVLEFRDPGGEDVRVAMSWTLRESHTSPMDHRKRVASRAARQLPPARGTRNETEM